jgi:hypothetical protein
VSETVDEGHGANPLDDPDLRALMVEEAELRADAAVLSDHLARVSPRTRFRVPDTDQIIVDRSGTPVGNARNRVALMRLQVAWLRERRQAIDQRRQRQQEARVRRGRGIGRFVTDGSYGFDRLVDTSRTLQRERWERA